MHPRFGIGQLIPRRALLTLVAVVPLATGGWASVAGAHPAIQPHQGGTITTRLPFVPDCLDPTKTVIDTAIFADVLDNLVSQDDKERYRPDLATSWKVGNGGKRITFSLRHGVRFSNGDPFTAQDVKFSLERALKSPTDSANLGTLQRVQVVDPYTVRLILSAPFRPLFTNLAGYYLAIEDPKVVKSLGTKTCTDPVGTGPFMIKSVGPAFNPVVLVRNPYHTWNPPWVRNQGPAYISQIVFRPIISDSTAVSSLLSGEVDLSLVAAAQWPRIAHNPAIVTHALYLPHLEYLGFNTAHPPFDSVDVRRAIAQAVDRVAAMKAAVGTLGTPAYSPLPDTMLDYDKTAKSYAIQYDPAAAKQTLQANHVTGPYNLVALDTPATRTTAELVQAELAQVGVTVNIKVTSFSDAGTVLGKGEYDLLLGQYGDNDPSILYLAFHSSQENGGFNFTFYKSATLDNLITEGQSTFNAAKAAKAYAAAQRFIDTNVIIDPLWNDRYYWGVRSRVKGPWHKGVYEVPYQDLWVAP